MIRATDVFAVSPFAWGVRAAVDAGRGDLAGFAVHAAAAVLAIASLMAVSAVLIHRISRGELDLGRRLGGGRGPRADAVLGSRWARCSRRTCACRGAIPP